MTDDLMTTTGLTDRQLLDSAPGEGGGRGEALLAEHGDLYRNHLAIALWIDDWRANLGAEPAHGPLQAAENAGCDAGLAGVIARLRQGDLLPERSALTVPTQRPDPRSFGWLQ